MTFFSKILHILRGDAVLIYQMGKVGSSSLASSIKNSFHVHNLYYSGFEMFPSPERAKLELRGLSFLKYILRNYIVRVAIFFAPEVKIITLVREPISRNISMFFQALPFWLCRIYMSEREVVRTENEDVILKAFRKYYNHNLYKLWFDKELKRLTGFNIYNYKFNKDKGYQKYTYGKFNIFVIRLENLGDDETLHSLSEFLGKKINLVKSNRGTSKWYSDIYNNFKNKLASDDYLDEHLKSKYAEHFYTQEELIRIKNKYS